MMILIVNSLTYTQLVIHELLLLGMDEWTWKCQELYPDQLRVVTRLRQTEEIYSP